MRKTLSLLICLLVMQATTPAYAVGKKRVRYLGGSCTHVKAGREGKVRFDDKALVFVFREGECSVPYERITSIEYGQHAGRRVAETVVVGILTLGLLALPMLLTKKRKHYATIGWNDTEETKQGAVVEFGKAIKRSAVNIMALRSGVEVEFEDERAKKHFGQ